MSIAALVVVAALAETPYALAASDNFSIYAPSQATADRVLRRSEAFREELALAWCGAPLPAGDGWTMIHVRLVPRRDRGRTSPEGHADAGHALWIQTDDPESDAFDATLRHELTHCLLATRHPGLPVWVHEGCASQYDIGHRRQMHAETVATFARTGRWPRLAQLLAARRISPDDRTSYGAAVSLAAYLIEQQDRRQFLQFAAQGQSEGWDAALRSCYGISDTAELQTRWQQWATQIVQRDAPTERAVTRLR